MAFIMAAGLTSCEVTPEDKFIGIQLWSVRGDMNADPEGTLRELGEMGYSYIESAGYQDGMFYNMEPETFTSLVEASGMKFISSHIGRELPTEDTYEETMEWWATALEAHERAGVDYIIQPFMSRSALENLDVLKEWADYFNELGEMCNARGMRFGFHNHAIEFTQVDGTIAYDFLLENTDPEKVFYQLDIYWIVEGGQDPVDYFHRYPGRFLMYHVKDEQEVGASGNIDFRRVYEHADIAGMRYHIVEVEDYNYEPLESVRVSLEFLLNADYVQADYR